MRGDQIETKDSEHVYMCECGWNIEKGKYVANVLNSVSDWYQSYASTIQSQPNQTNW